MKTLGFSWSFARAVVSSILACCSSFDCKIKSNLIGAIPCVFAKYSKSKFSQNTTNLLSKWLHVSTRVIIRPIIESCLRYIKWKCTFWGSQNVYSSETTWVQMRSMFTILYTLTHCGRVTQICVFNTVKLGTSASSP